LVLYPLVLIVKDGSGRMGYGFLKRSAAPEERDGKFSSQGCIFSSSPYKRLEAQRFPIPKSFLGFSLNTTMVAFLTIAVSLIAVVPGELSSW